MSNYRFAIEEWLARCPLEYTYPNSPHPQYSGETITGPGQLCNNEQLRKLLEPDYDWGDPVPADVFVFAEGEPPDRYVTKIGGLPYRPAHLPWPCKNDGSPREFLGQINFSDSKDIVGDLPGDLLLIFFPDEDEFWEKPDWMNPVFEWHSLGLTDLVTSVPTQTAFLPCYGYIHRTVNYPHARPLREEVFDPMVPRTIERTYLVTNYQATQIGRSPFFIQEHLKTDPLPGRYLCTVNSIHPHPYNPYPFINRKEPLHPEGSFDLHSPYFMIDDAGCLYVSIDDDGNLHAMDTSY